MQFFPLLRSADDRVFLVHAEIIKSQLHVGLLVVDGFIEDGWLPVAEEQSLGSTVYEVQLPQEVVHQPERYKGYAVICPIRHPA